MGVTVVALLLIIAAGFALLRLVTAFTMPLVQHQVQQTFQSNPVFVFFSLVGVGLAITCGVGIMMGRNWARLLFLVAVPILLLASITVNGFQGMHLFAIICYIASAFVLTLHESVEYFTGSAR